MSDSNDALSALLTLEQFPRAAKYPPRWVIENMMGPNVLWLTEALCQVIDLKPGMRVLDMGCGKAVSSIFLAKEFGVQVWATDLWIDPTENWQRIRAAEVTGVFPIRSEAHSLPFAEGFFDAAVSLDAYHYFGTDDLYLSTFARFLKPNAQIGIVVPGLQREFEEGLPDHLAPYWQADYWSLHSPAWWKRHWERSNQVDIVHADLIPNGWQHWWKWLEACTSLQVPTDAQEIEMVRVDAGRNLGFTRLVARKK